MSKRDAEPKKSNKGLDNFFKKRGPGRPGVRASEIAGRAYNHRLIFTQNWERMREPLLKAQDEKAVIQAFDPPYAGEFEAIAPLILRVLRDPDFPKIKQEAQINFLADSLAGRGWVSPRRSRDICEQERAREKRTHHIISYEYWITCSCGYKGKSKDHACPRCGAEITLHVVDSPFNVL
jgi:hypothetical protein